MKEKRKSLIEAVAVFLSSFFEGEKVERLKLGVIDFLEKNQDFSGVLFETDYEPQPSWPLSEVIISSNSWSKKLPLPEKMRLEVDFRKNTARCKSVDESWKTIFI